MSKYKVIDLFAGPGGLAEGFSTVCDKDGSRTFEIALSIEMERAAFATLRLRSFVRQFDGKIPSSYYNYIAGRISKSELINHYPDQWRKAEEETIQLTLGEPSATQLIDPMLDKIGSQTKNIVLIGGPPCQAYSLVGRARNRGVKNYDPRKDHRHFLYKEYIRIVSKLNPIAFVMENVKGMLSAKVNKQSIFQIVVDDLKKAGGSPDSYTFLPLGGDEDASADENVLKCENYGIPQCRHRVILVGIRTDKFRKSALDRVRKYGLVRAEKTSSVAETISDMSKLRSGLSKANDGKMEWQKAVVSAFNLAIKACLGNAALEPVVKTLKSHVAFLQKKDLIPPRTSNVVSQPSNKVLQEWLSDPKLDTLPNNETRGHMESDLARYAFAACFAGAFSRSPKSNEFPMALAPAHQNWATGKFADRFRVQVWNRPSTTVTSHISKDGHYFIHPDPRQCRSLTVREAARLQTFPDNYFFEGNRTQQYVQVGNAVPPLLAKQIGEKLRDYLSLRT